MSKIFHCFFSFFVIFAISNNILGETIFWNITLIENLIKPGNKGIAFLTIFLNDVPKDIIDFDNTVIIGIDLKNPDPSFKVQVHKFESKEDEEIYKIDFISEKLGKNEFIITLYDFENQRSFSLPPTEFEYGEEHIIEEEIIPDPTKTKIIARPLELVGENDTITFEFTLVDTKGNQIIGDSSFLEKLKLKSHEKKYSEGGHITTREDGKIFNVTMPTDYMPLLQTINIEFQGKNDTFNIFLENLNVTVILYPFYLKTLAICKNCDNITLNESIAIEIYLYNYKCFSVDTSDYSNIFEIIIEGPLENEENYESKKYYIIKIFDFENIYKIITKEEDVFIHSGTYIIKIYEYDFLIKEFNLTLFPKDIYGFTLDFIDKDFDPKEAFVDTEIGIVLLGYDFFGNPVPIPLEKDIDIKLINKEGDEINFTTNMTEREKGKLEVYITSETLGYAKLKIYYKGKEILKVNMNEDLPEFIFKLMKCIEPIYSKDELYTAVVGKDVTFYLQCLDKLGRTVKRGGEHFSSDNYFISDGKYTSFDLIIKDLQTGNYSFNFIPSSEGNYNIRIYLNEEFFDEINFIIEKTRCKDSTPFLCPNKNLCVGNHTDCIEPKNDCPNSEPFYCKVDNTEKCVKSQLECDCPEGYIRCDYMKYCVPENRQDMCADYSDISEKACQKMKQFKYLGKDGICRLNQDLSPTQKVCPIGKVLCADLSCRDNYDECAVSENCKEGEFRCPDQSCVEDHTECPSTISCQNKEYVCPDGTCVDNEIECEALPPCTGDEPYRCHDNLCAKNQNSCRRNVACGHKMALCHDLICRTTCDNFEI